MKKLLFIVSLALTGCATMQPMSNQIQQISNENAARDAEQNRLVNQRYDQSRQNYLNSFKNEANKNQSYTVTDQYGRSYIVTPR